MNETVSCVPCAECHGTGELKLAPKPPVFPEGDKGRRCNGCLQLFPISLWCGHNVSREEWYCSPGCYTETTGDTRPWDVPRPYQIPVVYIGLSR